MAWDSQLQIAAHGRIEYSRRLHTADAIVVCARRRCRVRSWLVWQLCVAQLRTRRSVHLAMQQLWSAVLVSNAVSNVRCEEETTARISRFRERTTFVANARLCHPFVSDRTNHSLEQGHGEWVFPRKHLPNVTPRTTPSWHSLLQRMNDLGSSDWSSKTTASERTVDTKCSTVVYLYLSLVTHTLNFTFLLA